jgi:(S)-citramalyl-CoA lyase
VTHQRAERLAGARSWLFTPGTRPHLFGRAGEAGADGLIIDLEDAVPAGEKEAAREHVVAHFAGAPELGLLRAVRINPPSSHAGIRDLDALLQTTRAPDAVVLPKSESPGVVALVGALFAEAGKATAVIALVETAAGVANIAHLAAARELAGIAVGAADLSADLGCDPSWTSLAGIRTMLVLHAAASGIPVIDSPFFDLADVAGLEVEARAAAARGFSAKAAIHPRQVAVINAAFTPSAADLDWAHRVLSVTAGGAALLDGAMVDEAVARRARRILASNAHARR